MRLSARSWSRNVGKRQSALVIGGTYQEMQEYSAATGTHEAGAIANRHDLCLERVSYKIPLTYPGNPFSPGPTTPPSILAPQSDRNPFKTARMRFHSLMLRLLRKRTPSSKRSPEAGLWTETSANSIQSSSTAQTSWPTLEMSTTSSLPGRPTSSSSSDYISMHEALDYYSDDSCRSHIAGHHHMSGESPGTDLVDPSMLGSVARDCHDPTREILHRATPKQRQMRSEYLASGPINAPLSVASQDFRKVRQCPGARTREQLTWLEQARRAQEEELERRSNLSIRRTGTVPPSNPRPFRPSGSLRRQEQTTSTGCERAVCYRIGTQVTTYLLSRTTSAERDAARMSELCQIL